LSENWEKIKLSARVFGHISQGMYRTPAGAIKELISNSFDANAEFVKIHTNFPTFVSFSCEDNGVGISLDEFKRLMERGFGSSEKRSHDSSTTSKFGRPVIGRLGIGILSLAQICTEFSILSHHRKSASAFEATIKFPPYTKEEVDRARFKKGYVEAGEYKVTKLLFDKTQAGVRIFTSSLRDTYRKRMKQLGDRYAKKDHLGTLEPYESFEEFIDCVYNSRNVSKALAMASDYDQLLFGLAVTSPLPYFQPGEVAGNIILSSEFMKRWQDELKSYNFSLVVDNLKFSRPLLLPSIQQGVTSKDCQLLSKEVHHFELKDGEYTEELKVTKFPIKVASEDHQYALYAINYDNPSVGGRRLRFTGYMFNQTGRLYPREIQGVLVRIKNVAIGGYDQSIMSYPHAEGPRFSMISMELFVEEGFEDALNIDRDSFNGLDPHYIRLQSFVHSLMKTVFPEIWTEEKKRNKKLRDRKERQADRRFAVALSQTIPDAQVRAITVKSEPSLEDELPVVFDRKDGSIELALAHPLLEPILKRKKYRALAQKISVAFERALLESSDEQRRRVFYELLSEILSS
jgi:hypothetical protein